jgi:chromosome segregation ATPase
MALTDDRCAIESWQPPGRFHLLWLIPLGLDAERLKRCALEACDDAEGLLDTVEQGRAALVEQRAAVARLEGLAERKESLQEHIDVLRGRDDDPAHDLGDAVAALVDHLHETRAASQAGQRSLDDARSRLRRAEIESTAVRELERAADAQERELQELRTRVAALRHRTSSATAGDTETRESLREVHRLVSIRLKYDEQVDVIEDLGVPLRDL